MTLQMNPFLNWIVEKLTEDEVILELEFQEAQKSFARENLVSIDPSAHPLQEEIDALWSGTSKHFDSDLKKIFDKLNP